MAGVTSIRIWNKGNGELRVGDEREGSMTETMGGRGRYVRRGLYL